ncbi:hypothetical protein CONLIGDRAFT_714584 [Coniochaeta ligniaria NRRL 30616]|uniref:2EXR domain-containing protein n=1 Tax=Coniochaeta ligniaria NRRL 30616 TaxID=1408157 RepID=A0A1J7IRA7_9PEZI|nr:hypothetical protein CONLIGDRAFT_714584 [Coniochaeta ligniaria NRRL 30616]
MSPTEFKYFPFLPKELRDQIWGYVVHNTQRRLLEDTGRAHFFTLYNVDDYSGERPLPEERRQARLVDAEEILYIDEDPLPQDPKHWNYGLAAPRADPWLPSTWDALDGLVLQLEWSACRESRDIALRHWLEVEPLEDKLVQEIAHFTSQDETRTLPIVLNRDLLVVRPLHMETMHWGQASSDFSWFFDKARNIALEFDPSWGYPAGPDRRRFGLYLPGEHIPLTIAPQQFVAHVPIYRALEKYCIIERTPTRTWFIDYRIRLLDGAVIDEEQLDGRRHVFRDSQYLYVEVEKDGKDWIYSAPDDGMDVHKFVEILASEVRSICMPGIEDGLGVLARVPLEEVEELGATPTGFPASSSTRFRSVVRRS